MNRESLPVYILACRVFENLVERYLPEELGAQQIYLDYGLHVVPRNLKAAIQEVLDRTERPGLFVLGYGLCGNGLHGINAGRHVLLIPRADDCIALFMGSYSEYRKQFDERPGTYFLSKGWFEADSHPLTEYQKYVQKYGEEQAVWLMDQQYRHYRHLAFLAHRKEDLDQYREKALQVAEYCQRWGMDYEEILGSDQYLRRLFEIALDLDQADSDFIVVPPGGRLEQSQFLR